MKRALFLAALLLLAAGYVFLQTTTPAPKLATLLPGGALVYLETPDFGRLLHDWDTSKVKADWLQSDNYAVFSRSNLFIKLQDVYHQYGEAAGFLPDLKSVLGIAGTDSALALYDLRNVEFLYVSRIDNAAFMKSQLWAVRDKFEQRQAGGVSFYRRTDAASKWTVAFAFTKGYLLLATRDDLIAEALQLLSGGANPSIAVDRWYKDATAAAPDPGELRMVMNLESLVKSVYFRSYWVQRNASTVRQYWAAVADVRRAPGVITEDRVFLRAPDAAQPEPIGTAAISQLLALVPPEAGMYKASYFGDASRPAAMIVDKLIGAQPQSAPDWRVAPGAVSPDSQSGTEADLETRIDEQPLPSDAGIIDSVAAIRDMVQKSGGTACLLIQSTSPAGGTFLQVPAAIVVNGAQDWDADAVRVSLSAAAGKLWTTSQLGAGWAGGTAGRHAIQRLDGLGTLLFSTSGHLLVLGNSSGLVEAVLDRAGSSSPAGVFSYAAGFRHLRERPNFERMMTALDFTSPSGRAEGVPPFFSGNVASLSRVLSKVSEIRITEEPKPNVTLQKVRYEVVP